jgi:predicted nucleic-acid-binding Zn-ribbon protein
MKNGTCPKCASEEIFSNDASPQSSDRVTLKEGIIGKDASMVTRYVCAQCGYLEYYLPAEVDRDWIRQTWTRVKA